MYFISINNYATKSAENEISTHEVASCSTRASLISFVRSSNSRLRGNFFCLRQSASCRTEISPNVNPALKKFSALFHEENFFEEIELPLSPMVMSNQEVISLIFFTNSFMSLLFLIIKLISISIINHSNSNNYKNHRQPWKINF